MSGFGEQSTAMAGKVAIVTGAGQGIGRAEAMCLAQAGATVVVQDRADALDEVEGRPTARCVTEQICRGGGSAIAYLGDVRVAEEVRTLVESVIQRFGGIDIVINNAGVLRDRLLVNLSDEEWEDVVGVNLTGSFLMIREACRYWVRTAKQGLPRGGRVINTTSTSGLLGSFGQANYAAAKAGIAALTLSAALEMAKYDVWVNAVAPVARTALTARAYPPLDDPDDLRDRLSPVHVARLVTFLAGPEGAGITGQVFSVSGGVVELYEGWRVAERAQNAAAFADSELGTVLDRMFLTRSKRYEPAISPGQAATEWPSLADWMPNSEVGSK